MPISNIYNILDITSYLLIQYIEKYIYTYQSKIEDNKKDKQPNLE